jgi:hypothetical protein
MNQITFTLCAEDLIAAQRLHQWSGIKGFAKYGGAAIALLVVLLEFISDEDIRTGIIAGLCVMLALFVLVPLIARYWRIPRMARRALSQDPALRAPATFSWDGQQASAESTASHWNQPLADFAGYQADARILLLYRQTNLFHLLPTRAFADAAQRQSLIDALVSSGVAKNWPPK